jgi:hypothetical protein
MLAIAALSVAKRSGMRDIDALQHYQQAIGSLSNLGSEEDLSSDGAFLTHFILLLYEVRATPCMP